MPRANLRRQTLNVKLYDSSRNNDCLTLFVALAKQLLVQARSLLLQATNFEFELCDVKIESS